MIKKSTIAFLTVCSLMTLSAQAEGMKIPSNKGMMKQSKMMQKKKHSPFLIKQGLPHLTKMVMKHWDDRLFALTPEQQEKLVLVRKETLGSLKQLKPQIFTLQSSIIAASKEGAKTQTLQADVEKLASLEAKATLTHLKCIENTKNILTKAQLDYLMSTRKRNKAMI
jgi:hypothetical protein